MNYPREITLPSGRKAVLTRELLGRDIEMAATIVGAGRMAQPLTLMLALFAQAGEIDGQPVVYEDLQALPALDVLPLVGLVSGGDAEKNAVPGSPAVGT